MFDSRGRCSIQGDGKRFKPAKQSANTRGWHSSTDNGKATTEICQDPKNKDDDGSVSSRLSKTGMLTTKCVVQLPMTARYECRAAHDIAY